LCKTRLRLAGYVTVTLMTFDKQSNGHRTAVDRSQIVVVTTALTSSQFLTTFRHADSIISLVETGNAHNSNGALKSLHHNLSLLFPISSVPLTTPTLLLHGLGPPSVLPLPFHFPVPHSRSRSPPNSFSHSYSLSQFPLPSQSPSLPIFLPFPAPYPCP